MEQGRGGIANVGQGPEKILNSAGGSSKQRRKKRNSKKKGQGRGQQSRVGRQSPSQARKQPQNPPMSFAAALNRNPAPQPKVAPNKAAPSAQPVKAPVAYQSKKPLVSPPMSDLLTHKVTPEVAVPIQTIPPVARPVVPQQQVPNMAPTHGQPPVVAHTTYVAPTTTNPGPAPNRAAPHNLPSQPQAQPQSQPAAQPQDIKVVEPRMTHPVIAPSQPQIVEGTAPQSVPTSVGPSVVVPKPTPTVPTNGVKDPSASSDKEWVRATPPIRTRSAPPKREEQLAATKPFIPYRAPPAYQPYQNIPAQRQPRQYYPPQHNGGQQPQANQTQPQVESFAGQFSNGGSRSQAPASHLQSAAQNNYGVQHGMVMRPNPAMPYQYAPHLATGGWQGYNQWPTTQVYPRPPAYAHPTVINHPKKATSRALPIVDPNTAKSVTVPVSKPATSDARAEMLRKFSKLAGVDETKTESAPPVVATAPVFTAPHTVTTAPVVTAVPTVIAAPSVTSVPTVDSIAPQTATEPSFVAEEVHPSPVTSLEKSEDQAIAANSAEERTGSPQPAPAHSDVATTAGVDSSVSSAKADVNTSEEKTEMVVEAATDVEIEQTPVEASEEVEVVSKQQNEEEVTPVEPLTKEVAPIIIDTPGSPGTPADEPNVEAEEENEVVSPIPQKIEIPAQVDEDEEEPAPEDLPILEAKDLPELESRSEEVVEESNEIPQPREEEKEKERAPPKPGLLASSGGIFASIRKQKQQTAVAPPRPRLTHARDQDQFGRYTNPGGVQFNYTPDDLLASKPHFHDFQVSFPANDTIFPSPALLRSPAAWPEVKDRQRGGRSTPGGGYQRQHSHGHSGHHQRNTRQHSYNRKPEPSLPSLPVIERRPPPEDLVSKRGKNAWVPGKKAGGELEETRRKVKSILNKMTPEKEASLQDQVITFIKEKAMKPELYLEVVNIIFDKAVSEKHFSQLYCNLCLRISVDIPTNKPKDENAAADEDTTEDTTEVKFSSALLRLCQQKFEEGTRIVVDTENKTQEEVEEIEFKKKERILGNVKFIGELYMARLLSERLIHFVIKDMLIGTGTANGVPSEEDIEALVKLLTTIGKVVETPKSKKYINQYFDRLLDFSRMDSVSSRVKYLILDLSDLRNNSWVPRRKEEKAKTKDAIRQEHERQKGGGNYHQQVMQDGGRKGKKGGRGVLQEDFRGAGGGVYNSGRRKDGNPTFGRRSDRYSSAQTGASRGSGSQDVRSGGRSQGTRIAPVTTNAWTLGKPKLSDAAQRPARPDPRRPPNKQPLKRQPSNGAPYTRSHIQNAPRRDVPEQPQTWQPKRSYSTSTSSQPPSEEKQSSKPKESAPKPKDYVKPTEGMRNILKKYVADKEDGTADRICDSNAHDTLRGYTSEEEKVELFSTFLNLYCDTTHIVQREVNLELLTFMCTDDCVLSYDTINAGFAPFFGMYEDSLIDLPHLAKYAAEILAHMIKKSFLTLNVFNQSFETEDNPDWTVASDLKYDRNGAKLLAATLRELKTAHKMVGLANLVKDADLRIQRFLSERDASRADEIIQEYGLNDIFSNGSA